jgi:hypothetical protein
MTQLLPITRADKVACLEREVHLREQVYPRWVEQKKMSYERANREIDVMREILSDYKDRT